MEKQMNSVPPPRSSHLEQNHLFYAQRVILQAGITKLAK